MKHGTGWSIFFAGILAGVAATARAEAPPPVVSVVSGVTLRQPTNEQHAFGPQAIAIDDRGDALVLDTLAAKVWRVSSTGATALPFAVPAASEDLIAYRDGAMALYRPVDRGVQLVDREGKSLGALRVPSVLAEVGLLERDVSHRVRVQDPNQETALLGSPAAPLDDASVLRSRREGVFGGYEVIVKDGAARLRVLKDPASTERKAIARELVIGRGARAAMIVGASDGIVCARLEKLAVGQVVHVQREAVCVDAQNGRELLRVALPAPGLYVPRRELALGGTRLSLAHLWPTPTGVVVRRWEVRR